MNRTRYYSSTGRFYRVCRSPHNWTPSEIAGIIMYRISWCHGSPTSGMRNVNHSHALILDPFWFSIPG